MYSAQAVPGTERALYKPLLLPFTFSFPNLFLQAHSQAEKTLVSCSRDQGKGDLESQ